jgi:catechol 2,3-dioxygenase-like lactoylglutathione lyase family enzyme
MLYYRPLDRIVRSFYSAAMEIDHLMVPVGDYDQSKRFYEQALRPLGFTVRLDWPDKRRVYLGIERKPSSLWLCESEAAGSLELSLVAADPDAVHEFHDAAVAAGGRTAGEPGVRPERSREYYAARVLDPDGNSIEAVFRGAATSSARRRDLAA